MLIAQDIAQIIAKNVPRPRIGVLSPQEYMMEVLEEMEASHEIVRVCPEAGDWSEKTVQAWVQFCKDQDVPCVIGLAQKDAWHHVLINSGLGNPTVSPRAFLTATNKYLQRTIETDAFWFTEIDPATERSNEALIAKVPDCEWPVMLKSTSLSLGRGVFRCDTPEEMRQILQWYRENEDLQAEIATTNEAIVSRLQAAQAAAVSVPAFIAEHRVDMNQGWVEYCYEGCVMDGGELVHYGLTEEVYMEDGTGLAYLCPPVRLPRSACAAVERYVEGYAAGLVAQGYRRQFFNLEFWVAAGCREPTFRLCEVNPRSAHSFHFGYGIAAGTHLYHDVFECVLHNRRPGDTPWSRWKAGASKVSAELLVNAKGAAGKRVSEVLDVDLIARMEAGGRVFKVRHVKADDYMLSAQDASAAAGTTLKQIWISCESHAEAAAKVMALRPLLFRIPQADCYPAFWTELGASYSGPLDEFEQKDCN